MGATESQPAEVKVHVRFGESAAVNVGTGVAFLDHLLGELARSARMRLALEVAPGTALAEVAAAGRALGAALREPLRAPSAPGRGDAWLPADEALAGAVIEVGRPLLSSNADFSHQRVGGLESDVVGRFLSELAEGAGLNIHIRVLEGKDPQNVLHAIFKALGAAIGQACAQGAEAGR